MQRLIVALVLLAAIAIAAYAVVVNRERFSDVYQNATSTQATNQFYSEHVGVAFAYPGTYQATTTHSGNAEREWHIVTLLPKDYVPPQGGEGPPAINVQAIPNLEGLSLEAWVKGDARSNWKLANPDGGLGSTTVGGEPGLAYRYSGLYETSAVAVARGDVVYLFEVGWLTSDDHIRKDFETLLESVTFVP